MRSVVTVDLDFGALAFDGTARWLEVRAEPTGAAGEPPILLPRQPLTPVPYSIHALNAGTAGSANNAPWSGVTGKPAGLDDGDLYRRPRSGITLVGTAFGVDAGATATQSSRKI